MPRQGRPEDRAVGTRPSARLERAEVRELTVSAIDLQRENETLKNELRVALNHRNSTTNGVRTSWTKEVKKLTPPTRGQG